MARHASIVKQINVRRHRRAETRALGSPTRGGSSRDHPQPLLTPPQISMICTKQWEATSWRCNGLEGKTIIFGPFALCPGTTTRARPPRRRLGREVVQTGAVVRAILGRLPSSKPRPRPRSIASVVAVHVRAPVCPPLPLRAACADVRACAASRTSLASAPYHSP